MMTAATEKIAPPRTTVPAPEGAGPPVAHGEPLRLRGSQIIAECLLRAGVDTVFAYPGAATMEIHHALRDSPIRVVLPRHEQGGGFAANGYARATGRVGVAMSTSGPGATNLVTAITDAYMDSVPTVFLTGQVPRRLIGRNAFQETDIVGVTRPIVKHNYLVQDIRELPAVFAEAFHLARTGRPGPVLIDMPKDIIQAACVPEFPDSVRLSGYRSEVPRASEEEIGRLREAMACSERPCLYVGGGIVAAGAAEELLRFVNTHQIPVATTLMGVGAFPDDHRLSLKWLGMHGSFAANYAANECDLLIGIGVRFDDRVTGPVETFATHATIVHVDIDPTEINKNKRADIGIVGDARDLLERLNRAPSPRGREAWLRQVADWKGGSAFRYSPDGSLQPQHAIRRLSDLTHGDATIVTGVGQHQMWTAQFYTFRRPRQLHTSGGLGAMGFGLPAAIGVKLARPTDTVVLVDGDGSFQMNIQELGTLYAENVPVKMMILNNQHLGMVAQWEDRFYGRRRGNTDLRVPGRWKSYPDFVAVASGYGVPGRDVWSLTELDEAIREMLDADGPFLLNVHVAYWEHVLPMIPAGGTHRDMILE